MTEVEKRRELRRQKILQNAELRKQKIFGLNSTMAISTKNDEENNKEFSSGIKNATENLNPSDFSNEANEITSLHQLSELLKNIPDPMDELNRSSEKSTGHFNSWSNVGTSASFTTNAENQRRSISQINGDLNTDVQYVQARTNIPGDYTNGPDITDSYLQSYLDHKLFPVLLALIVSLLFTFKVGGLLYNSLIIPFLLWEFQQVYFNCIKNKAATTKEPPYLNAILILCGLKRNIFIQYFWILQISYQIFADFSLYMSTVIVWHVIFGI